MKRLKMTVSYDGTMFHGFQRQKQQVTVQEVLESCLSKLFLQDIKIVGSGRTDARVHAIGQVISFSVCNEIPLKNILRAINNLLPKSIVVIDVEEVSSSFHARFDAKAKKYIYKIYENTKNDPFKTNYALLLDEKLNLDDMEIATTYLLGEHDFSSFQASGGKYVHPIRTIYEAYWVRNENLLTFNIKGNGFLYHMVRNIVGSLLDVGRGRINVIEFNNILKSCNRKNAGKTAPAQGLYLEKVFYTL